MWISTATDSKSRSTNLCLDGLTTFRLELTWFPRVAASCGRPKSHSRSQLGPHVPQLGPSRPIFGLKRRPRGFPGRFWSDFGPLREALEAQKHRKIQGFCCISRSATDIVQIVQISPLEGQKRPPRGAQERPRTPQERPRRPQDGSKSAKSVPRAPPEPPKDGFRAALAAKLGPTGTKEPPGGHFGPPAGRFCTLRGSIFGQFSSLGKRCQSCPVGKACASLRPAPLYLLV